MGLMRGTMQVFVYPILIVYLQAVGKYKGPRNQNSGWPFEIKFWVITSGIKTNPAHGPYRKGHTAVRIHLGLTTSRLGVCVFNWTLSQGRMQGLNKESMKGLVLVCVTPTPLCIRKILNTYT